MLIFYLEGYNGKISCKELYVSGTKNFFVDHPSNPNLKIKYSAVEGPEAAMYYRGKSLLKNGKCRIDFPEHFKVLVNDTTLSFSLTPHSIQSKGLAVSKITNEYIEVQELNNGNGNYEFSYVIYGIRKGYEDYQVYLYKDDANNFIPAPSNNFDNINK